MDKKDSTEPNIKNNTAKKKQEEKSKIIIEKLEIEAKDLPKELPKKAEVKKEEVLKEGEAKCDRCKMTFEERLAYKVEMSDNIQWGVYQDNDKNLTVSNAMKELGLGIICDTCYNTSIDGSTGSISREWFE